MKQTDIILTGLCLFVLSCANSGETAKPADSETRAPTVRVPETKPENSEDAVPVEQSISGGILKVRLTNFSEAIGISGYLVGFQDQHILERESPSSEDLVIRDLAEGRYDLIILAKQDASEDSPSLGRRISGIQISNGKINTLRDISLVPTIDIEGFVRSRESALAGVTAGIAGTSLQALSDEQGFYRIRSVPQGNHLIELSAETFQPARIDGFRVSASEDAASAISVPNMLLLPATEITGTGLYPESTSFSTLDTVLVAVAPSTANQFRIADQSDLNQTAWQSLVTTLTYRFESPGTKTLYIQFARDGKQLSNIFQTQFDVE